MKALVLAVGCLVITAKATIACSVVEVLQTLPSCPDVRLTVLNDRGLQRDATLVVTLHTNGQQVGPVLRTNTRGSVDLRNLAPGTYCITATADPKLGAVLCLVVSKAHNRKRSEFSLKLVPLPPPPPTLEDLLEQATKSPPEVRARTFEGTVTDVTGAPISRASLVVYVHHSEKKADLIKVVTDAEGRFSVTLNPGRYAAAFQSQGFKTRFVGFEIGPEESQEPVPIVLQVGTCT